jgi:AMP phosphorylase
MKMFKSKPIDIEAGEPIVIMNPQDTAEMGLREMDRVHVEHGGRNVVAIVQESHTMVAPGEIGVILKIQQDLGLSDNEEITIKPAARPQSIDAIKKKMDSQELTTEEINLIVHDMANRALSRVDIAAYITAVYVNGMNMRETKDLTLAMVKSGETISFGDREVYDFHSIGGCPGNKVTPIIVPIVAAAGLLMPKTFSRAISSAAGTADIMESICNVTLTAEKIRQITLDVGAVLAWGGAVRLAPVDDMLINVEYGLAVDPHSQVLASIMSKKKAVGAKHLVLDIPTGYGTKAETEDVAKKTARDFIELGEQIGINVECAITYGGQPLGRAIGPALEAAEAIAILEGAPGPRSVVEKSLSLAGMVLEMGGITRNGYAEAESILKSGRALDKFRQIIDAQGGKKNITASDAPIGKHASKITADKSGYVNFIDNRSIVKIAREAGAPYDKGAGVVITKKGGTAVERDELIYTIYADHEHKLKSAETLARRLRPVRVESMVLDRIPTLKRI